MEKDTNENSQPSKTPTRSKSPTFPKSPIKDISDTLSEISTFISEPPEPKKNFCYHFKRIFNVKSLLNKLTCESHYLFRYRIIFCSFVMCYILIVLPFRCVFLMAKEDSIFFFYFDIFLDIFLYFDMFLISITPYTCIKTQKKITNFKKTSIHYLRSKHFHIDVFMLLPFEWAFLILKVSLSYTFPYFSLLSIAVFRLNRSVIVYRYTSYFKIVENFFVTFNLNPVFVRLIKLFVICGFVAHWVSCMFFLICVIEGNKISQQWTKSHNLLDINTTWDYKYSFSLYWSILTLIGYGGLMPNSDLEMIFSTIVVVIGVGFYATVIGAVGSLMLNMDNVEASFREKMERINKYIENKKLKQQLKDSILTYYKYIWHMKKGLNEEEILKDVPEFLRMELSKSLNRSIIEKVPLFKDASSAFILEIVNRLTTRVALPSSYIIMQGETGKEMFFLNKGSVDVVVGENLIVHNFKPGDFFGEIALVKNVKRTASCIARDFCDLFVLHKSDFELIMSNFKDEAKKIYEKAEKNEKDTKNKKKNINIKK